MFKIQRYRRAEREERIQRQNSDRQNGFCLPEVQFMSLFRFQKDQVLEMCDECRGELQPRSAGTRYTSVEVKVLCVL